MALAEGSWEIGQKASDEGGSNKFQE